MALSNLETKARNLALEILQLPLNATYAQIKKKFRTLAVEFHPDKTKGDPDKAEQFKAMTAAKELLDKQETLGQSNNPKAMQACVVTSDNFLMNYDEQYNQSKVKNSEQQAWKEYQSRTPRQDQKQQDHTQEYTQEHTNEEQQSEQSSDQSQPRKVDNQDFRQKYNEVMQEFKAYKAQVDKDLEAFKTKHGLKSGNVSSKPEFKKPTSSATSAFYSFKDKVLKLFGLSSEKNQAEQDQSKAEKSDRGFKQ